ncbi:MAG: hypothetical protein OCC46_16875 [Pseudodesulfovibrio sp.]
MNFKYRFEFPDRANEDFVVCIDNCSLEANLPITEPLPQWTELAFNICPHCTLDVTTVSHCPLAARISGIIDRFEALVSHDEATVKVVTEDRMYARKTTVQRGLGSLLGLVIATSGCPHTAFFRPMARFHLPFSSEEETIYRVAGMYLIGQFLQKSEGKDIEVNLSGLSALYAHVEIVNLHISNRIRAVTSKDASVNAIVLLDFFAKNMPYVIEDHLEDIRHVYSAYLDTPVLK